MIKNNNYESKWEDQICIKSHVLNDGPAGSTMFFLTNINPCSLIQTFFVRTETSLALSTSSLDNYYKESTMNQNPFVHFCYY